MSEESVICWDLRLRVGQRLVLVMLRFHNLLNESASLAPMTHTQERMVLGALIAHKIKLQGLNSRTTCHRAGGDPARVPIASRRPAPSLRHRARGRRSIDWREVFAISWKYSTN